ncbi:MAG: hypothetical protein IT338_05630 [Thermomicrobiales bacterium]|nr:hypothetical protein [Thermomicrobiales bacterium]
MTSRPAAAAMADHVIGIFSHNELSAALAATHRAGFGPQARVIDGARGDASGQLHRMGLHIVDGAAPAPGALLIVVIAPGRTPIVAGLFGRLGAESIMLASRRAPVARHERAGGALSPDIQIVEDPAAAPGV